MNITIITLHIHPSLSPRAFRSYELAKQLAKEGNNVTIYALLGKYDYSKIEKETGLTIKNLGFSKCGNTDSEEHRRSSLLWRAIIYVFGRYLQLPQMELLPMAKKAALNEINADLIISIARPFAIHFGVAFAKKRSEKFPVWISDCGDPFMGNVFATPPSYFKSFEKMWGSLTDYIAVPFEGARNAYYEDVRDKIRVIPQGFDFTATPIPEYEVNSPRKFIFAGNVFKDKRDPSSFLCYLTTIKDNFKFIVYTKTPAVFEKYMPFLKDKLEIRGFIPREDLIKEMGKADFLVNVANKGSVQSPSKLIDYTLAARPILEISEEFDKVVVDEFLKGDYHNALPPIDISQYDIKNVAKKFIELARVKQ